MNYWGIKVGKNRWKHGKIRKGKSYTHKFTFVVRRCICTIRRVHHFFNNFQISQFSRKFQNSTTFLETFFFSSCCFFFSFILLYYFSPFPLRAHRHFDTGEIFPNWVQAKQNSTLTIDTAHHRLSTCQLKSIHTKVRLGKNAQNAKVVQLGNFFLVFTHPISSLFFYSRTTRYWKKVPFTASPTMQMCAVL